MKSHIVIIKITSKSTSQASILALKGQNFSLYFFICKIMSFTNIYVIFG